MAWYMLFSQFEGIAEAWLERDNWTLFQEILRAMVISTVTSQICHGQML